VLNHTEVVQCIGYVFGGLCDLDSFSSLDAFYASKMCWLMFICLYQFMK